MEEKNKAPKLIILKGLPASGKTTWAKEHVTKSRGSVKRVNRDDLRAMIDNGSWHPQNEKQIIKLRNKIIDQYLKEGYDVICDDTNLRQHNIDALLNIAEMNRANYEIKEFDIPVSVAEERDALRDKGVGANVIRRMWREQICEPEKPWRDAGKKPLAILVDIDGTLAHMTDRDPYQEQYVDRDWYDTRVGTVATLTAQHYNAKVIITSGRHENARELTEKWLVANGFKFDEMYMRTNGDNRKDYTVKSEFFDKISKTYEVVLIFDDRVQVCDYYRQRGYKVFQVADGRF